VQAFATVGAASAMANAPPLDWLVLAIAAYAWQRQYPLYQFDPNSPPERYSPAGTDPDAGGAVYAAPGTAQRDGARQAGKAR
jgi:hypothetical protein